MKKTLVGLALLIASSASGHPNQAPKSTCLSPYEVQEIRRQIKIDLPSEDDRLCDESARSYRLFANLIFLKSIRWPKVDSPLSKNILPEKPWDFFAKAVKSIVHAEKCGDGQMAFVRPWSVADQMNLCPDFYADGMSFIERLPILLHEARHFDGDNHSHVHCQQGRLTGMRGACDESVEAGGGYAVELETLVRLLAMPGNLLTPGQRAQAKFMAIMRAVESFNRPPLLGDPAQNGSSQEATAVYVIAQDGNAFVMTDEDRRYPVRALDLNSLNPMSRSTGFNVFPKNGADAYAIDMHSKNLTAYPAAGSTTTNYNLLPISRRPRILRIFNDQKFSGVVTHHNLQIAFGDNPYVTTAEVPFKIQLVFTGAELGVDDPDSIYVVSEMGQMHRVHFLSGRRSEIFPSENLAPEFKSIATFRGKRWGLRHDGRLMTFKAGAWTFTTDFRKFLFLSQPFYWSERFFE